MIGIRRGRIDDPAPCRAAKFAHHGERRVAAALDCRPGAAVATWSALNRSGVVLHRASGDSLKAAAMDERNFR
jgi:hypothetical protein